MSDQMVPVASLEFTLEIQDEIVKRERSMESRPFVRYKTYSSLIMWFEFAVESGAQAISFGFAVSPSLMDDL